MLKPDHFVTHRAALRKVAQSHIRKYVRANPHVKPAFAVVTASDWLISVIAEVAREEAEQHKEHTPCPPSH